MVNTVCAALATVLLTGATTVVKGPDGTRRIEESVPAKDGVRLYTAAVAPADGKCPTVVMRSPKKIRAPRSIRCSRTTRGSSSTRSDVGGGAEERIRPACGIIV